MTHRHRILLVLLLIGIQCLIIVPALAQARGQRGDDTLRRVFPIHRIAGGDFDFDHPSPP